MLQILLVKCHQQRGLETIAKDPLSSPNTLNVDTTLKYNMTLEFHKDNSLEAEIYVGPLGRYAICVYNHEIEFQQEIQVNLWEDTYIDPYGTMYLIVYNP